MQTTEDTYRQAKNTLEDAVNSGNSKLISQALTDYNTAANAMLKIKTVNKATIRIQMDIAERMALNAMWDMNQNQLGFEPVSSK